MAPAMCGFEGSGPSPSSFRSPHLGRNRGSSSMDGSVHIVCPHCDTINRVPRPRLGGGRFGHCQQALFEGHPVALDTARFERHLAKRAVPPLVDFWASCCGPCPAMAPELEKEAAGLEPMARLVKGNTDERPSLAER